MRNEHPGAGLQSHQRERWDRAITMSALGIIASGILGIAAQDAFFSRPARKTNPSDACIANLRSIDGAKCIWAMENQKSGNDTPTDRELFGSTHDIRVKPVCPAGGAYTVGSVSEKPRCSIRSHHL